MLNTDGSQASVFVFISYSRANKAFVERLTTDLGNRGVNVWFDQHGLRPGTPNWEQTLRDAIQSARAVLLIASPDSRKSSYVSDELSIAAMYKRPVYPIWADGDQWADSIRMGYGSVQFIDARGAHYPEAVDKVAGIFADNVPLNTALPVPLPVPQPPEPSPNSVPRNPYKGLNAFTTADQGDFFGRDALIDDLYNAVEHMNTTRFLAVVGPSGSGKSSVVMAGLLPRLAKAHPDWLFLTPVLPGFSPLRALSVTLAKAMPAKSNKAILDDLNDSAAQGLDWLARTAASQPRSQVVLLVDQFEELFTQTTDEIERQQFIDLLCNAASEPDGPLRLILTLRADFYDRPINYPVLGKLFEGYTKTIPPLSLSDVRDSIEKPAAQPDVALTFDDGLVAELAFDVREQIGAMPLLEFTLDQLFQRRKDHRLTMAAYQALGGVRGALAKHAEDTYAALPGDSHRYLTRALFLRLIEPGDSPQDTTRRRAALTELDLSDPVQNATMATCRESFVRARLLTTAQTGDMLTIEVSHEALIREWPRLALWLTEARADVRLQKQISQEAAAWLARGERPDDDGLYRGLVLENAVSWLARGVPSSVEARFVTASLAAQNKRVAEDKMMQKRLKTLRQDRIGLTVIASVTLALVIIAGYFLILAVLRIGDYKSALNDQQYTVTAIDQQINNARSTLAAISSLTAPTGTPVADPTVTVMPTPTKQS